MSNLDPNSGPRRPAFLTPREEPPFWRSPEFVRFLAFAFVALGGAAAFLWTKQVRPEGVSPSSAYPGSGPAAPDPKAGTLSPELAAKLAELVPASDALTPEQRTAREAFLSSAFEGALRDQADGSRLQDTTGSRKLLEHIAKYEPEEFTRRVELPLVYAAAIQDPEAWRGRIVRASGLLGEVWTEKLARPVAGRDASWRAQFGAGEEFGEPSLLEFIDRPFPDVPLRELMWRPVEFEGVFYRMGSFESEFVNPKGQTVEAVWSMPWIFVRNIRLLDEGQSPTRSFLNDHPMLILGVLAFVIFGGRLLISWVQVRRRGKRRPVPAPTNIRAMFDQKLREKGLPPAPPSPPRP